MANWRLMKGGRAFYKEDAARMAESVNWVYDYRQALYNNGKVTIIMGDHDFLDFNAENHKKLLANFHKVKVVTIKDAGHNIWIDDPKTFKIELIKALTK
jgi:pimeloyl-ACP methyl ester carboxylesterase